MKYLIIKMPDGAQFKVPRHIVAEARAFHYEVEVDGKSPTSPEVQAVIDDYSDQECIEWAYEMTWDELEPYAAVHQEPESQLDIPYREQLCDSAVEIIELEEEV